MLNMISHKFFFTDCTKANFTITSEPHGYVHHYGIFGNFDFLEYSKTQPPAYFCFTNNFALKELVSGKCVGIISNANKQLILTNNCRELWRYNPENETLIAIKYPAHCFGPWEYTAQQPEIKYIPGLSPCAHWNRVVLNLSKCVVFLLFFDFNYLHGPTVSQTAAVDVKPWKHKKVFNLHAVASGLSLTNFLPLL